jgi:hypothetical protein
MSPLAAGVVVGCGRAPHPTLAEADVPGERKNAGSGLIGCLAVDLIGRAIMGAQTGSRLFERLVLRFKLRYHGSVVGRIAHGRALSQLLELMTYCRHPIVDLLAQRLI